jgi:hypothetical protein
MNVKKVFNGIIILIVDIAFSLLMIISDLVLSDFFYKVAIDSGTDIFI